MPAIVSSSLVRDWAQRALSGLGDARSEIDALNVFPVPDGDTGTNLYLTMESACQAVDQCWSERRSGAGCRRGCAGDVHRRAHGRTGQLRGDPVPDPARHQRDPGRPHRRRRARRVDRPPTPRPGRGPRLRGGRPPGRGHDPDGGPGRRRLGVHPRPGGGGRRGGRGGGRGAGRSRRARAHPHDARVAAAGGGRRRRRAGAGGRARRPRRGRLRRAARERRQSACTPRCRARSTSRRAITTAGPPTR